MAQLLHAWCKGMCTKAIKNQSLLIRFSASRCSEMLSFGSINTNLTTNSARVDNDNNKLSINESITVGKIYIVPEPVELNS